MNRRWRAVIDVALIGLILCALVVGLYVGAIYLFASTRYEAASPPAKTVQPGR